MAAGGYAVYEVTYRGTDDRERGRLLRGDMTFAEHLVFALKHEATDLHVLRKLFLKVDPELVVPDPDLTLREGAIAPWAQGGACPAFSSKAA